MEERRGINRVDYRVKSVIVTCDTFEKFYVDAINVSPLGMGLLAPAGTPNLVGRQIIIVADTLIMNADVLRQEKWKMDNSSWELRHGSLHRQSSNICSSISQNNIIKYSQGMTLI